MPKIYQINNKILDRIILSELRKQVKVSSAGLKTGLLLLFLLFTRTAFAQHTVTGTVKDEKGLAMPGVSVKVKTAPGGAITDGNGKFAISTVADGILEFSYIGYLNQEVKILGKSTIQVALEPDAQQMDEVVVVGYTSKSKSQIVSSVSTVTGKQLNDVTSNSTSNLLQGKAAGVVVTSASGQPGAATSIRIRGTGTISAGAEPLTVVDGVIGGSANPRDIESVTVLKDAAATGLYGSRAANGVIVITTKQGKSGKTQINYSGTYGVNTASQGNFNLMNGQQLKDYSTYLYSNDYDAKRASYIKQLSATNPNPTQSQIDAFLTTKGLPLQSAAYLSNFIPETAGNTDWRDLAFRTAYTNNQNINISGGDSRTHFYIGANYYNEQGTLINTGVNNINFRVNLDHQINDRLKVTTRINAGFGKKTNDQTGALYQSATNMPWDNPFNADGSPKYVDQETQWFGRDHSNFVYLSDYNVDNERTQNLSGDLKLEYKINKYLNFTTSNRYTTSNSRNEVLTDARTPTGKANSGELKNVYGYSNSVITSNLFNTAFDLGKHHISGIAGFEYQQNYMDNMTGIGYGIQPGLEILDATATPKSLAGTKSKSRYVSELFMGDYNYDNRYFGTVSLRNDGSSKFGRNHMYGLFYSFAGGWLISNESFFHSKTITNLKLRASYGVTGNTPTADYGSLPLYTFNVQYNNIPGGYPSSQGNPNLTWETPTTINAGMNIGFWNRIELNVDVYQRTNKDLIIEVPLSSASGFYQLTQNIGTVRNRGIDIELNTINLTGAFKWNTTFNIGFNKNKVGKLYQDQPIDKFTNQRIAVGQDMNSWFMREWAGVNPDNGEPMWYKSQTGADGSVTTTTTNDYNAADRRYVGTSTPNFTGGMGNEFSYKNFSLNAFFNFVSGSKIYNSSRELFDADGAYPQYNSMVLKDDWNRWEKAGDIATHPKAVVNGNKLSYKPSSRYLEDGSYLRLRNVTFAYNFPESVTKKLNISNLRVFVSGDNLLTLTKFSGMDPEVSDLEPNTANSGVSGFRYPISKKVMFGVNLNF